MTANEIVLDANLLVLLVVGAANPKWIRSHRRLTGYDEPAYNLLRRLISRARRVVVTPHVLTEASNLALHGRDRARDSVGRAIASAFAYVVGKVDEFHVPAADVVGLDAFARLGLTDSVLLSLSARNRTLLSADGAVCDWASRNGFRAIYFTDERKRAGIFP